MGYSLFTGHTTYYCHLFGPFIPWTVCTILSYSRRLPALFEFLHVDIQSSVRARPKKLISEISR